MKLLTCFLGLYLLMLSCMPCTDGLESSAQTTPIQVTAHDHSHHQDNHTETCTPFCICQCCSTITLALFSFPVFFDSLPVRVIRMAESFYLPSRPVCLPTAIWQPPRA